MDMMKNAQEIKKKADALNHRVQQTQMSETDSTGLVKVTVNGMGAPLKYEISPELLKKVSTFYDSMKYFLGIYLSNVERRSSVSSCHPSRHQSSQQGYCRFGQPAVRIVQRGWITSPQVNFIVGATSISASNISDEGICNNLITNSRILLFYDE